MQSAFVRFLLLIAVILASLSVAPIADARGQAEGAGTAFVQSVSLCDDTGEAPTSGDCSCVHHHHHCADVFNLDGATVAATNPIVTLQGVQGVTVGLDSLSKAPPTEPPSA